MTVKNDIKEGKGYILGVVSFATVLGAFLIEIFHFRTEPTLVAVSGAALAVIVMGWLIQRSEARQVEAMKNHQVETSKTMNCCRDSLEELKKMAISTQRSTLRIELNDEIARHPENHDSILRMAEKYFLELSGNWVETDVFLLWASEENAAGRRVLIPPALLADITSKSGKNDYFKKEIKNG